MSLGERLAYALGRTLGGLHAGERRLSVRHPALSGAPGGLNLTSSWFADGEVIPLKAAGRGVGDNLSPPLAWSAPPAGTASLALLIEDPDAPLPRPFVHLIAYGLPPNERMLRAGDLSVRSDLRFGRTTFGHLGYAGPRGLPGHGLHRYVFQVLAISEPLAFAAPPGLRSFLRAIGSKVLARGELTGLFGR